MNKLIAKPIDLAAGMAGGLLAGLVFRKLWKVTTGEKEAPASTDTDRGWGEILAAAALQGAIYALVKASIARASAGRTHKNADS
ncbi:DUF4235 domain-containing protein [Stackebrandtia soli]|uniref:DUF4235 domain-containing protein n=1 Tax=Stackebrandtia soli TaxID=1892856 RepID=UPI0039EA65E5